MDEFPQFVPQEVCLSCDGCCRFKEQDSSWRPKITKEEIDRGSSGNPQLAEEILSKAVDEEGYIKAVECHGRAQCTFFHGKDNMCHIYEQRPFECQLYPFLLMKKGDGVAIGAHLSCPYIQERWKSAEFQNHVKALEQYFQKKETLEFISRNNSLVGDYSEYGDEIDELFVLPVQDV